jgi:hypothetical protein
VDGFAFKVMASAGAKLTWEYVVDVGTYSSIIPGNGARKLLLDAW